MFSQVNSEVAPEQRRVTRQTTKAVPVSRNPLEIPEILNTIMEFLPVADLKSCRIVSSSWKEAALNPMRKKSAPVTFREYEGYYNGLNDMERFLQCFSVANSSNSGTTGEGGNSTELQVGIPITKFVFQMDVMMLTWRDSDRDKAIIDNFLQASNYWGTEITLDRIE